MTVQELYDFALAHECGELTALAIDVGETPTLWAGAVHGKDNILYLHSAATNQFRNLQTLLSASPNKQMEIRVQHGGDWTVRSLARGETPDGFAKALVLQCKPLAPEA